MGAEDVEIGPDDGLYFVGGAGSLEALDTQSQSLKWAVDSGYALNRPSISPEGSILIVTGAPDYSDTGFVKGFRPRNGHERWTVNLAGMPYPESRAIAVDHPRITPDSTTAYVSLRARPAGPRLRVPVCDRHHRRRWRSWWRWIDTTNDVSPSGIWHYKVAAYDALCATGAFASLGDSRTHAAKRRRSGHRRAGCPEA